MLDTERCLKRYEAADQWPAEEAMAAMLENQLGAFVAVRTALPALARAAEAAAARLEAGGRLIYAGAGASGRLAVQDGVELHPTFGWPREHLRYLVAGGETALVRSIEGAEDDAETGATALMALEPAASDVVIAVAASGTTPFTCAVQRAARAAGALTVALACNPGTPLLTEAEHPILLATGPEFLAGSTRMTAGTAQKMALNLLSTEIMLLLGRVHRGRMVQVVATNEKLVARARRIVTALTGASPEAAAEAYEAAGRDIRLAVLLLDGLEPAEARARLEAAGGRLGLARSGSPA